MTEPDGDQLAAFKKLLARVLRVVHQRLAPETTVSAYLQSIQAYETAWLSSGKVTPTIHGTRTIGPEEAARLPDNSADYETVTYVYEGLDEVKAMIAEGLPVAFVTWHHGARYHADYGLARVLPQTAIFSRRTYQYGKVFAIPMIEGQMLGLVRMNGYLREGRPIFYYLDGAPLGKTVHLPILGIVSNLSTGPIGIIRAVEGMRIVPVTNYYRDGDVVEYIFHPPMPAPDRLSEMPDTEILTSLLDYLEQDQKRRAPEQVMLPYILHREHLAREANEIARLNDPETP